MRLKSRLIILIFIIALLSISSALSISNSMKDKTKEDKKNIDTDISVVISTTGFSDIYHDDILLVSDGKMCISGSDGIRKIPSGEIISIKNDYSQFDEKLHVEAEDNIRINSINRGYGIPEYSGSFDIYYSNGKYVLVNNLNLEDYLTHVVPSEMPKSFGHEALKAQSVCARNYAVLHMNNPSYPEYDADLDDSVRFQVYNNSLTNDAADNAIKETEGQVLLYNEDIISTYYYSTSWGYSADTSVWNSPMAPYYISKSLDSDNTEYLTMSEEDFKNKIQENKKAYEAGEAWYRWNFFISKTDLINNLNSIYEKEIRQINNINIISRKAGGAVGIIRIDTDKGNIDLSKESMIRDFIKPSNSVIYRDNAEKLKNYTKGPSSFFYIEPVIENDIVCGYMVYGGGLGHGLGMSQNCAKVLCSNGYSYDEILKFFYQDTELGNIYQVE